MFLEVGGMILNHIRQEESFRSLVTDESGSGSGSESYSTETGESSKSSVSLAERADSLNQTEYQRNNAGGCCFG